MVGTLPSGCLPRPETGAQVPMAIPVRRMTLYKGFAVVCARLRRGRSEAEMYPEAPYPDPFLLLGREWAPSFQLSCL